MEVDVDLHTPDATDLLCLWDISDGAGQVIVYCLYGHGILGLYRTGAQRRVEVGVVMIHKPGLLRVGEEEKIDAGGRRILRASDIGVSVVKGREPDHDEKGSMRCALYEEREREMRSL